MTFDLQLIKEDSQALRGFFAAGPYRQRTARGREEDSILLLIQPRTEGFLSERELSAWQEDLSKTYFKSQGSVTMAMRAVFGEIDAKVKAHNLEQDSEIPSQVLDVFLGVIHHGTLFGAQSGKVYCLHLKPDGMQLYHAAWADDSPIGLLPSFESRFFQLSVNEGDLLIIAPDLPESWLESSSQGMHNSLRSINNNLSVLQRGSYPMQVLRLRIGAGQVTEIDIADKLNREKAEALQKREEAREAELRAREEAARQQEEEKARLAMALEARRKQEEADAATRMLSIPLDEPEPLPAEQDERDEPLVPEAESEKEPMKLPGFLAGFRKPKENAQEGESLVEAKPAVTGDGPSEILEGTMKSISHGAGWLRRAGEKTKQALDKPVLDRDGIPTPISGLSVMTKLLIAIIVPLLIVALAVGIYLSKGISTQFDRLLNQARGAISSAQSAKTPEQRQDNWQNAYAWLAQAETYKTSEELVALKAQVQEALDSMTGAVQMDFTKILSASQVGEDAEFTQIISFGNELFLLDEPAGKVIRLTRDEKGYMLDGSFNCGEGLQQGKMLGKVQAITQIPLNNKHQASLLALDGKGNAAFCKAGSDAAVITLQAPSGGWGKIEKAYFDTSNSRLYVFDPSKEGFWIYTNLAEEFPNPPVAYFENAPFKVSDVKDLTINREESFYLLKDGQTAHCLASNVTGKVDCQNPMPYIDKRANKQDGQLATASFSNLSYAPAPDAAVYYLDSNDASLYQFSLKLNLNDVQRGNSTPAFNLKRGISGFGIAADRMVYLAFGADLYAAPLP